MGAEVRHLRDAGEAGVELVRIVIAVLLREEARAEIRRVSDDGIRFRPLREEGVSAENVLVEIGERERVLGKVKAVGGGEFAGFAEFEFLGEHEGDFCQFAGEGDDIEAEEIREEDACGEALGLLASIAKGEEEGAFEPFDHSIRAEEEVAASAGRIKDAE